MKRPIAVEILLCCVWCGAVGGARHPIECGGCGRSRGRGAARRAFLAGEELGQLKLALLGFEGLSSHKRRIILGGLRRSTHDEELVDARNRRLALDLAPRNLERQRAQHALFDDERQLEVSERILLEA